MKKFFKWFGIILGSLLLILIIYVASVFVSHDRYWFYSSGGPISDRQAALDIHFYDLALEIFPDEQAIAGDVTILLTVKKADLDTVELDLIDNFEGTLPPGTEGWQPYWDASTPTKFNCALQDGSLHIDYDIAVDSWATCSLFYDSLRDWAQYRGAAFRYQADAPARIA